LRATADGEDFGLVSFGAFAFEAGIAAVAGAFHGLEFFEFFSEAVEVDFIGVLGVWDEAEVIAGGGDDFGELFVIVGGVCGAGCRFEDPEDDEEAHHEHDEVGEGEDPFGAFFAFGGFAFAGFFGHGSSPQRCLTLNTAAS